MGWNRISGRISHRIGWDCGGAGGLPRGAVLNSCRVAGAGHEWPSGPSTSVTGKGGGFNQS